VSDIVYLNGAWLPRERAVVSVDDRGFLFGDGVYEVLRVVQGRYIDGERHFRRLSRSLAELELPDPANAGIDLPAIGRDVAGGGAPPRLGSPRGPPPPTVFVAATPFLPKPERAAGVAVITRPDIRWYRCDIKSVNLLPNVLANQRASERGAYEAILVRDGVVTEATHSSVFAVLDGVLRTHPNGPAILPGITREVVLELAAAGGMEISETALTTAELARAEEVLLTGTTTDVMPVTSIDGRNVGMGTPGSLTRRLGALLDARMRIS
jgi:D-alanine transaminase